MPHAMECLRNAPIASEAAPLRSQRRRLTATLRQQTEEAANLNAASASNLKELGYGG
jgi:hypothetical protein